MGTSPDLSIHDPSDDERPCDSVYQKLMRHLETLGSIRHTLDGQFGLVAAT